MLNPEHSEFLAGLDQELALLKAAGLFWLADKPPPEVEEFLARTFLVYGESASGPAYSRERVPFASGTRETRRGIWVKWPPTAPPQEE